MRINHQLVYQKSENSLFSSINVSLFNDQFFKPKGKKAFSWGQMIHSEKTYSQLGIVFNVTSGKDEDVQVSFYDGEGLLGTVNHTLKNGSSLKFNSNQEKFSSLFARPISGGNIWYTIKSERPDISGFVVTTHRDTLHSTGEHSY